MKLKTATFRFYDELNDFLPAEKRKISFPCPFSGKQTIKTVIESLGVPHTEIDLIIVNNQSVGFSYLLQDNDSVSIYPTFESLDITPIIKLRPKPLCNPKFILDVHLGKLAKYLRLLGFNSLFDTSYKDAEIAKISQQQQRIVLTRDKDLLKNNLITHGYWLRKINPKEQLKEIITRFNLQTNLNLFSRCLECNGKLIAVDKKLIKNNLPKNTEKFYQVFYCCESCQKIYWQGSHYHKMKKFINEMLS